MRTPPTPTLARSRRLPLLRSATLLSPLSALVLLAAPGCERQEPAAEGPLAVQVVRAEREMVPITREHPGRTAAVNSVEIRARVRGTLEQALFREGADVQKGDLLFVIEQAPYRAAIDEAAGALARARASASQAQQDWKRARNLFAQGAISEASRDAARTSLQEAVAVVRTQEAALEQARLDLGYTEVRAPISGRVGRIEVDVGNLVGAGQETVLTHLVQLDPIYVYFEPPERERLEVIKGREAGTFVPRDEVQVRLFLSDGTEYPETGRIDFVDNRVDPSAGTVRVRAVFPNPKGILLPGEFADVHVVLGRREAVLVPERALIEEQGSARVLVAGDDGLVESRSVDADGSYRGQRIIASGLEAGERVLVDNLQRARPGMRVEAREKSSELASDRESSPAPSAAESERAAEDP